MNLVLQIRSVLRLYLVLVKLSTGERHWACSSSVDFFHLNFNSAKTLPEEFLPLLFQFVTQVHQKHVDVLLSSTHGISDAETLCCGGSLQTIKAWFPLDRNWIVKSCDPSKF